uniref:RIKEN cDNA 4933430I17 gene n=1 Tax=Cricetulus griseus TaxID=10029 RepID=A0A8C2N8P9_CRIGR
LFIGFCLKPFIDMNLPNEDQWDETICNSAVCQHPQCWSTLRRIERGHPRILDSSSKFPREVEDKLPRLTIVNIMDTCLWTPKRVVQPQPSHFPKERSLLSKPATRCHRRSQKALLDKDVTSHSRPPKLSVLNLNEAKLPFPEDVRNMVVTWVPEDSEKIVRTTCKCFRESLALFFFQKTKPSLYFSGRQYAVTHSRSPGVIVPPPSPVHLLDQLGSDAIPLWAQFSMLPQDLLKDQWGQPEPCFLLELKKVKIELTQNRPLRKTRPDSALSSKMYLTVHRLTLQRPSLRFPEHLRKLQHDLKRDEGSGPGPLRTRHDLKRGEGSGPGPLRTRHDLKRGEGSGPGPLRTRRDLKRGEGVSIDDYSDLYDYDSYYTDYIYEESPEIYESIYSDLDERMVEMTSSKGSSRSGNFDTTGWNPELKLLRILQASVEEDEENRLSRAQSEVSLDD